MITTIIIFLVLLSLLVFVHELGHFVVAKKSGMKVHEFGFGFPPRLLGLKKIDGRWQLVGRKAKADESTIYSINAIPLGGFVKIMGEDSDANDQPDSFTTKSFWAKFGTVAAGVMMNVFLAWVLLSGGYMFGLPVALPDQDSVPARGRFMNAQVAIMDVRTDSVAERANLAVGDIVRSADGQPISSLAEFQDIVHNKKGQTLNLEIQRLNERKSLSIRIPGEAQSDGSLLGVGLALYGDLQFGFFPAWYYGAQTTYNQLTGIVGGIAGLFRDSAGLKNVGGPVKIAKLTGQVADLGVIPLVQFTAFLSLNLAILNSLPLPALDGGRALFLVIEKLRRKKNNALFEQYANFIGFVFLLGLMLLVTARDLWNL